MKTLLSLLMLMVFSLTIYGQQKSEVDYLKEWHEFKKENAPFNNIKRETLKFELLSENIKPKLGDLSYKSESFIVQEIIGVALMVTAAVKEYKIDCNEVWKDPAKYLIEGYY